MVVDYTREQSARRTIWNNCDRTTSPTTARQLSMQAPWLFPSLHLDGFERRVADTERDEVRVVFVEELFQRCDLLGARHLRVGEGATRLVGDRLDGGENRIDDVWFLW